MSNYCIIFLYFIIYAFIGWTIEVIGELIEKKRFINRGFLMGPICPIYGWGGLLILYVNKDNSELLSVFLKTIFICSVLEYFTSFFMEKLFKARWWDYSRYKFNINGRICLETMLPFGVLGCLVVYVIHPFVKKIVYSLNTNLLIIISIILLIIYIIDNLLSLNIMNKIKNQITKEAKDSTELIRNKVIEWIDSNSLLYKRIKNAFPRFKISINIKNIIKK